MLTGSNSDSFSLVTGTFDAVIPWHYSDEKTSLHALYELANRRKWNASLDIPWSGTSCSGLFPCSRDANPLVGFAAYDRLPESEQRRLSWWQHGIEISEILHGEQGALLITAQLLGALPTTEAKLSASAQVADEARHVEFFSRYLLENLGWVHPPCSPLQSLIESTVKDTRWDMKFIACQVLIENLAITKFQELRRTTRVPVLRSAIDLILADEARHVRFGVEIMRQHIATLSPAEREWRSSFVLDGMLALANSLNAQTQIAAAMDWDQAQLRRHLRHYRRNHPEAGKRRFRQLALSLQSIGLFTRGCQERLQRMHVLT